MGTVLLSLMTLVVLSLSVDVAASSTTALQDPPRRVQALRHVVFMVPSPMNRADLDWYFNVLDLSEEQRAVFDVVFAESYDGPALADVRDLRSRIDTTLTEQVVELRSQGRREEELVVFEEGFRLRKEVVDAIERLDEAFLLEISNPLFDLDLPPNALEYIRADRRRARASVASTTLPGDRVDLINVLRRLRDDELNDGLRALCMEYSLACSHPMRRRAEIWARNTVLHAYQMYVATSERDNSGLTAEEAFAIRMDALTEGDRLWHEIYQAANRVQRINDIYFQRFLTAFDQEDEENRRAFELAVLSDMYPTIYQDIHSAERILIAAGELNDLSPDQAQAIEAHRAVFDQRYTAISAQMARRMREFRDASGRTGMSYSDEQQQYQEDMYGLYHNRLGLSRSAVFFLRQILSPEQQAQIRELERYDRRLSEVERNPPRLF